MKSVTVFDRIIIITDRVMKVLHGLHFRLYFAKWMVRLGRFHHAVDPGDWAAFIAGGILVPMTLTMNGFMNGRNPNIPGLVLSFLKWGIAGLAFIYFIWEFIQGIKYLHAKSERYLATIREDERRLRERERGY